MKQRPEAYHSRPPGHDPTGMLRLWRKGPRALGPVSRPSHVARVEANLDEASKQRAQVQASEDPADAGGPGAQL